MKIASHDAWPNLLRELAICTMFRHDNAQEMLGAWNVRGELRLVMENLGTALNTVQGWGTNGMGSRNMAGANSTQGCTRPLYAKLSCCPPCGQAGRQGMVMSRHMPALSRHKAGEGRHRPGDRGKAGANPAQAGLLSCSRRVLVDVVIS